jgi:hypothetical protein
MLCPCKEAEHGNQGIVFHFQQVSNSNQLITHAIRILE